jgi:signal transduction histidine kinase
VDHVPASLPRRMMAAFAGVELLFKLVVGYSYLDLAGARTADERWTCAGWYLAVSAPLTAAFFVALWRMLGPVRRWAREQRAGSISDATIQGAGEAVHALSLRSSRLWMLEWSGTLAVLVWLRPVSCFEAAALFLGAMVTGSLAVARSVATWCATPGKRLASQVARERAIELRTPAMPLRGRLALFGFWIAIAPTSYLASFAFTAQVMHLSRSDMLVHVAVCGFAVAAFAVITAMLLATSVTTLVASMAAVIRDIAHRGDVSAVARVPQHLRDEVGSLAISINEMIDRLERTEAERATMRDSLAVLNQALECRVAERTMRLFEANAELQGEIAARAKVELELRHAQKLEAIGRLAAGIAHEINTPVQFVSDSVEFISTSSADLLGLIAAYQATVRAVKSGAPALAAAEAAEAAEVTADLAYVTAEIPAALELARDGLERVKQIVRSMKTFAHNERDMRDADLNHAILSTLTIARHEYKYVAAVVTELGDLPLVRCHVGEISQVVLNLLVNAAHAIADVQTETGPMGRIEVRTWVDDGDAVIAVSDTGSGIPDDIQPRIFEPFFTTKGVDRGTGQGLAIARSVVAEKHGGSLTFVTERDKGSTFTIRLPIAGVGAAPASVIAPDDSDIAAVPGGPPGRGRHPTAASGAAGDAEMPAPQTTPATEDPAPSGRPAGADDLARERRVAAAAAQPSPRG